MQQHGDKDNDQCARSELNLGLSQQMKPLCPLKYQCKIIDNTNRESIECIKYRFKTPKLQKASNHGVHLLRYLMGIGSKVLTEGVVE